MNFFGLNSPAIFVISVIVLIILGPKRVEKGWLLFQRLLKFLLSNKEDFSKDKLNLGSQLNLKPEVNVVKEEVVEAKLEKLEVIAVKEEVVEAKLEKPEAIAVKEEVVEAKSEKPGAIAVKEDVVEAKSEKPEVIAVKDEVAKTKLKRKKTKPSKVPKE